jgi:hypothetical protein
MPNESKTQKLDNSPYCLHISTQEKKENLALDKEIPNSLIRNDNYKLSKNREAAAEKCNADREKN